MALQKKIINRFLINSFIRKLKKNIKEAIL